MRVIADSYSNMCSQSSQPRGHVADATLKMQVQGNAILYLFLEDGICIRHKHTFVSSNDTNDIYLAQLLTIFCQVKTIDGVTKWLASAGLVGTNVAGQVGWDLLRGRFLYRPYTIIIMH